MTEVHQTHCLGFFMLLVQGRSYLHTLHSAWVVLITSRVSGRGYRIGPVRLSVCVCVCVCVSVSSLATEPLNLRTQYLVQECT